LQRCKGLLAFPADAVFGVFEEDAFFQELVADGVGAGEVALLLGEGAVGNESVDVRVSEASGAEFVEDFGADVSEAALGLGPGQSGPGEVGVAVFEYGEDAVEFGEQGEGGVGVGLSELRVIGGGVDGAEDVEDGGAGFGGIEVVGEGGGEVGVTRCDEGAEFGIRQQRWPMAVADAVVKGAQAVDGVGGFGEAVEGEVELMTIGHAEQKKADGGGAIALEQEVAEGVEVAFGLGHLLAFDEKKADVKPVACEGLVRGGFTLRDLVFVMRKHEVFAAGVEIEGVAEIFHCHGGAFDVPAGAAVAERRIPRSLGGVVRGLGGFPESEVTCGVFFILVEVDAGAVFDAGEIFLGELAVGGEARDAEVPAAVLGLVGDVLGGEAFDEGNHAVDVFGGARDLLGLLDAERGHVFEEGLLEFGAELADGFACGRSVADDLIVDVGDVHDVVQFEAVEAGGAAEDVDVQKGAEVADVAVVIDSGAAAVEAQGLAIGGEERFDFSGEGVEEFESHAGLDAAGRGCLTPLRRLLSAVVYSL
jgi:hypothetical protein